MNKNISNFKLYIVFNNNKKFHEYYNEIKSRSFRVLDTNLKQEKLKKIVNLLCNILEENFKLSNSLPKPEIKFDIFSSDLFGEYSPKENIIHLNENYLTPAKFLHEFRHYIQYQLKEPLYEKGVNVPIGNPFYLLQAHEINAYNFEYLFEMPKFKELNSRTAFDDGKDLFMLGYLNRKTFRIEHNFYKNYNIIFDLQELDNKLPTENFKTKDFEFFYEYNKIKCKYYELDNKKFFNFNFNNCDVDFGILDNKCEIYAINKNIDVPIVEEFVGQFGPLNYNQQIFKKDCQNIVDIVSNFCNLYDIKELEINPCTPSIHRRKFKRILDNIKQNYSMVQSSESSNSSSIYNIRPKTDIVKNLAISLNIDISNRSKNKIETMKFDSETYEKESTKNRENDISVQDQKQKSNIANIKNDINKSDDGER